MLLFAMRLEAASGGRNCGNMVSLFICVILGLRAGAQTLCGRWNVWKSGFCMCLVWVGACGESFRFGARLGVSLVGNEGC